MSYKRGKIKAYLERGAYARSSGLREGAFLLLNWRF
jgi:hypothetical protein